MKLTYDPKYNVAYIHLQDKTVEVESLRLSDQVNIDMAPDGTVYGIEFLNANQQLRGDRLATLVVVNEGSGQTAEVRWPT